MRQLRGIVATDWEDNWEYRECIYYIIGEFVVAKGREYCDTLGSLRRQKGSISGGNGEISNRITQETIVTKGNRCCDILGSLRRQIGRILVNNRDGYLFKI